MLGASLCWHMLKHAGTKSTLHQLLSDHLCPYCRATSTTTVCSSWLRAALLATTPQSWHMVKHADPDLTLLQQLKNVLVMVAGPRLQPLCAAAGRGVFCWLQRHGPGIWSDRLRQNPHHGDQRQCSSSGGRRLRHHATGYQVRNSACACLARPDCHMFHTPMSNNIVQNASRPVRAVLAVLC